MASGTHSWAKRPLSQDNVPATRKRNANGPQVISPGAAYLITDILSDPAARIPAFGEGSVLELPFPAAVKTGTTTDWRDNWTIGYSTATHCRRLGWQCRQHTHARCQRY